MGSLRGTNIGSNTLYISSTRNAITPKRKFNKTALNLEITEQRYDNKHNKHLPFICVLMLIVSELKSKKAAG